MNYKFIQSSIITIFLWLICLPFQHSSASRFYLRECMYVHNYNIYKYFWPSRPQRFLRWIRAQKIVLLLSLLALIGWENFISLLHKKGKKPRDMIWKSGNILKDLLLLNYRIPPRVTNGLRLLNWLLIPLSTFGLWAHCSWVHTEVQLLGIQGHNFYFWPG